MCAQRPTPRAVHYVGYPRCCRSRHQLASTGRWRRSSRGSRTAPALADRPVWRHPRNAPASGAFPFGASVMQLFGARLEARDGIDDFLARGVGALPAVELHPLALLEVLVVLEEVADALEPVRADLRDVVDVAVAAEHLVDGHREQLHVVAGLVLHLQQAD